MTDKSKLPRAPQPLADLDEKMKLRKFFPESADMESLHARESRKIFFDFVETWQPLLEYLSEIRTSRRYQAGDKCFSGRVVHDAAEQKIKLMLGFVEDGVSLTPQAAGLVMSAPVSRVIDPEKSFLADAEKGQAEQLYTGMKEFDFMAAMRFSLDVEKLEGFSDRFLRVFTPLREEHFYEHINRWIVQQVMGKPEQAKPLDMTL